MLRDIKESTRHHHLVTLRSLRASKLFFSFKDFTPANIMLWDNMLHQTVTAQAIKHAYHKRLKPYNREAIQFGLLEHPPYDGMKISSGKSQARKYITEEVRNKIEKLPLKGGEAKARDLFIFACFTGLAYSDLVKISKADIQHKGEDFYLRDRRQKTGVNINLFCSPKRWKYRASMISTLTSFPTKRQIIISKYLQ